ncbi:MAG: shikimate kinase [Oscillospiraceae bacterium]|nr:shikimate kinase [Oscillospiraceae bacterium]MBR0450689.1 shikimate kinase [Oscillospiraceae bacterium]
MSEPVYGLIGSTLRHSWSVPIHKELGNTDYQLFEIADGVLDQFFSQHTVAGLNVTIPFKRSVIPFCSSLDESASEIGSVNTLIPDGNGGLIGYNTDAYGLSYMAKRAGASFKDAKVIILGTGGTSRTATYVARKEGAAQIVSISRTEHPTYDSLSEYSDFDILINTTPVGMYPDTGISPVDLTVFSSLNCVLDVIYNPARTKLLMQAEKLAIPYSGGLPMLVAQACESERLFTGKTTPAAEIENLISMIRAKTENIVIIGMPGCGKTTVGNLLGKLSERPVIDIDTEIEKDAGISIPAIFSESGESGFRKLETRQLAKYGKESGIILVTGGGSVTREENYDLLHQNGILYQLDRDLSLLSKEGRPISLSMDLNDLFNIRKPMYDSFRDYLIDNNRTPQEAAEDIWRHFLEHC